MQAQENDEDDFGSVSTSIRVRLVHLMGDLSI